MVIAAVLATGGALASDWVKGVLLALGLAAAYGVLALVRPHKPCRRCNGMRRSRRWFGQWGRPVQCRRCRGRGRHQRFGARAVHRFAWSLAGGRGGRSAEDTIRDGLADRMKGQGPWSSE